MNGHTPSLPLPPRSRVLPASHRPEQYETEQSLPAFPCHGLRKQMPVTDDRFDALVMWLLKGHRVREGGVVSTKSGLEDSREDLVEIRPTIGILICIGDSRDTPVQQGASPLGLQHSVFLA